MSLIQGLVVCRGLPIVITNCTEVYIFFQLYNDDNRENSHRMLPSTEEGIHGEALRLARKWPDMSHQRFRLQAIDH